MDTAWTSGHFYQSVRLGQSPGTWQRQTDLGLDSRTGRERQP